MAGIRIESEPNQLPQRVDPQPEGSIILDREHLSQNQEMVVIGTKTFNYVKMVKGTNAEAERTARRRDSLKDDPVARILFGRQQTIIV